MFKTIFSIARLSCLPTSGHLRPNKLTQICWRSPFRVVHSSGIRLKKNEMPKNEVVIATKYFNMKNKNKETYAEALEIFMHKDPRRRGHVEFIYAALKFMEEFGVDYDLESYKNLIRVLPTEKFIPTNVFQSEFLHFPKQQQCAVDVLDTMERKGIMPDSEMGDMLRAVFGKTGIPVRKYARMMYWMQKFQHTNPWPVPRPTPKDPYILAELAIQRITSVDKQSVVSVLQTRDVIDAVDDTWIVSGQSPVQQRLLNNLPEIATVHIEGPFLIWLRNMSVQYFLLKADPIDGPQEEPEDLDDIRNLNPPWALDQMPKAVKPFKSVHEQEDGIILGVCATGTSSRDSLLSWIRLLQRHDNPRLGSIPVLFKLRSQPPPKEVVAV